MQDQRPREREKEERAMTFGEGSSDLEFVGRLISAVDRLAIAPESGMTHIGAVNARIYDAIGGEAVRACIPGDPSNCPIATYLREKIGPVLMSHAKVTELTVGTGAIQVTFAPEYEGLISRRFVLDTPLILATFIREFDKARDGKPA